MDRETAITHLRIIHTWADYAREHDLHFITTKHLEDIVQWADDAIVLLKEQKEKYNKLAEWSEGHIVFCKDCRFLIDHYGFMDDGYCRNMRDEHNIKFKPDKDWFCADGEKR